MKELKFLKMVFTETNGYPHYLVTSALEKIKERYEAETTETAETEDEESTDNSPVESKLYMLKLPYASKEGEGIVKSLKNTLKRNLPNNQEVRIVHNGTKLSKHFNIKDKVDEKHRSNIIYYKPECKNKKCKEGSYVGETARRKIIRTDEHAGKDKESWIFKHSSSTKHPKAKYGDFMILDMNYQDRRKRKLAEAM